MNSFSRPRTAAAANMSPRQLDYLLELGVLAPDVGEGRKQFSLHELRMAVICGAAMYANVSPKALTGPIGFVRERTSFPKVELPETLEDIMLEISAERMRGIHQSLLEMPAKPIHLDERASPGAVKYLAPSVYARHHGNDPLTASHDDKEAAFRAAENSSDDLKKQNIAAAIAKAAEMLSAPMKWDIDTLRHIECAADFELACRDKKSFYLHMLADENEWTALLHEELAPLEDRDVWLVVDLRRLFRARRGALIA
ncbi:MAG TPA: hypothetical protein PLM89_09290 [Anaerolineales bacterium]|nr:hypothetical protein [Anaerolineales bacterium]